MLISVVVPIYNVEKYLNRCVDSILNQTFTDFELILVDDGSPDNCGKICDEYAEKDNRVRVIHKPNGGLSDARNAGIEWALKNSDSEWITFIDSDDWVHLDYLEFLLWAAVENNTSVSVCGFVRTENKSDFPKYSFESKVYSNEDFWIEKNVNAVIACAKLYKKRDFTEIRYPVGKIHEDEFTTHKILFKYDNIAFVNEELYYYFTNPEGIMNSVWSPKKLVKSEAICDQINFLSENKLNKALEYTIKKQLYYFSGEIKTVTNSENEEKKKYLRFLRKKLRGFVKKYKDKYSITVKNYPDIYECLYPKRMWIYWIFKAQIDKIKK